MLQRKKVFHYVSVLKHDKFGLIPKHPEADCQKALLLPDEEGPALLGKQFLLVRNATSYYPSPVAPPATIEPRSFQSCKENEAT